VCFLMGNVNYNLVKKNIPIIESLTTKQTTNNITPIVILNSPKDSLTEINNNVLNKKEPDSGICYTFLLDKIEMDKTGWDVKEGIYRLIHVLTKERFFNDLRTIQQSGYIVKSFLVVIGSLHDKRHALKFVVQSSSRPLKDIKKSIEVFIKDTKKYIEELDLDVYNNFREAVATRLVKKDDNIHETFSRYLYKITSGTLQFGSRHKLQKTIMKMDRSDVLNKFEEQFINNPQIIISNVHSQKVALN